MDKTALDQKIKKLDSERKKAKIAFVEYIREADRRQMWKENGFKSLKDYCATELGYDSSDTRELLVALGLIITQDQMTDSNPKIKRRIEKLKTWRGSQALKSGEASYLIFSNHTLMSIAKENPKTTEQLAAIAGLGPKRIRRHGQGILKCISGD